MKEASKILYLIGTVVNIIAIVAYVLLSIVGIVALAFSNEVYEQQALPRTYTEAQIKSAGLLILIVCIIAIVIYIVALILAIKARKKLNNNTTDTVPHIIMIVIGVLGNVFYLLGGVFGLVAETNNTNN